MSVCEYEQVARLSSEPVLIVEGDGTIVAANSALVDVLGGPERPLVGERLVDLSPDSSDVIARLLRDCLDATDPVVGRLVLTKADASLVECSCKGLLLRPPGEGHCGLIGLRLNTCGQIAALEEKVPQFGDETRRRQRVESHLAAICQSQDALNDLHRLGLKETSLEDILKDFLDTLFSLPWLKIKSKGAVFLVGDRPGLLVMKVSRGFSEELRTICRRVPFGQCLCGRAALSGDTVFADCTDDRHETTHGGMEDHGHYCMPLIASGKEVLGVLTLFIPQGHVCDEAETEFLEAAAAVLAGIVRSKLTESKLDKYVADLETVNRHLEKSSFVAHAATHAKSDFLANMSHEIRTPMTAIIGYIELIAEGCQNRCEFSPTTSEHLEAVRRNADYLLGLINNILDLSKIEAGECCVERIRCDLPRLVSEIVALMKLRAEEKGLSLVIQYDGSIPETIATDPIRLRQILVNLMGNAIKFTERGEVRVAMRVLDRDGDEPRLQIKVVDTGIGMTEGQIPRLFQPFTPADSSTTRRFGGTGLGLTISKRLAEMLGGELHAESVLGEGSVFTATVATGPLRKIRWLENPTEAESLDEQAEPSLPQENPTINGRILLVEDGPDNQRLISYVLKKAGADVQIAENGLIAIDAVEAAHAEGRPFDVILMDMQMPVMDGYAATRQLRAEGFTRPIVAVTAHAMSGDRQKCLQAGCNDYLTKQIDRSVLLTTVAQYVAESSCDDTPKKQLFQLDQ